MKNMKKILTAGCLMMSLLTAASFASCNDDDKEDIVNPIPNPDDGVSLDYNTICFYYDWYGNDEHDGGMLHWAHHVVSDPNNGTTYSGITGTKDDISTNFYPELGRYSNRDPQIIKKHMEMFKKARIGVASVSWWNENNTAEDEKNRLLLDEADKVGVKVCFHIEPYGNRSPESVKENIKKIVDKYGDHPAFYRFNGKPMFFIYDSYLTKADEWARLLSPEGSSTIRNTPYDSYVIKLWLNSIKEEGDATIESHFDGFYTYFAAMGFNYACTPANWVGLQKWAEANNKLFIPSVGPGYIDTRVRPWNTYTIRDRNEGKYYDVMYEKALASKPQFISITSFNEWHEGTQLEPAVPYSSPVFTYLDYGALPSDYYLTRTAHWVGEFRKWK